MTDDFKKVVKLFDKKHNNSVEQDNQGIFYVRTEKDENGNFFNAEHLIEFSNKTEYIIRVMKIENETTCMYNYKVSGDKLATFISEYSDDSKTEKIIEINKCFTHDLA